MPELVIFTNVAKSAIPDSLLAELSSMGAKLLGKPEAYFTVRLCPDQMMAFGGTTDPCAMCTVCSIGKIGIEENKKYSATIAEKLNGSLKIDPARIYMRFHDVPRENWGWNGDTFFKGK